MQWDGICYVLFFPNLFPIYNMDVRNIVCQDITVHTFIQQLYYWTIMMANNGHYLYMLNKYETFIYWTKNNSKTCLPNGKDSGLSLLGKNMKTCNKLVVSR